MSDETLEDGWQPTTPPGDTLLRDFVDSSAHYFTEVGRAVGAAVVDDAEVAAAHHGADFPFANVGIARRPLDTDGWTDMLGRLREEFAGRQPFVVASAFPTPDLRGQRCELIGHPPFMIRPAGGAEIPTVDGLTIDAVTTAAALAEFESTLIDAYPAGPGGTLFTPPVLAVDGVSLWLARRHGEPVATALAHHGGGLNGVELVSCRSDHRGHRIGEAVTWQATLAAPDRPAALIASDLGRGVYQRMGYAALTRFTLWLVV